MLFVPFLVGAACAKPSPPAPACAETAPDLLVATARQQQVEIDELRRQVQDLARSCPTQAPNPAPRVEHEARPPMAASSRAARRPREDLAVSPAKL
jgi:hypothetical protein